MFTSAVPILPAQNVSRTITYYEGLGFEKVHDAPEYGIVKRDQIEIHFWVCDDKYIAESSGCRIVVTDIETLYKQVQAYTPIHPNAPLQTKPWGTREFAIIDNNGNILTFVERRS